MLELINNLGVRSFADIKVYRDGKLRCELKDCGNDLLDSWFTLWATGGYENSAVNSGILKLGEGGGPTTFDMTTLESTKLLNGSSYYGWGVATPVAYSYEAVTENSKNYLVYTASRSFNYTVGAWIGILRELGMQINGYHNHPTGQTKTVQTRIILPTELEITAEDQLVITYKFKVKVLNEITTQVISAIYNKVPVDVTITHTPGFIADASRVLDNFYMSSGHTTSDQVLFSNIGVGGINQTLPMNTRQFGSVPKVIVGDPVNKTRTATITISAEKGNYPENVIEHLAYNNRDHHSKWSFNPPIPKTNRHIVKMSFVTKLERL